MLFEKYDNLSDGAWSIEPAEFKQAFTIVTQVYQDLDSFDLSEYSLNTFDENGNPRPAAVDDTPLNRVFLALRDWYHEEPVEKFLSASWRIIALARLIKTGQLSEWIEDSPGERSLVIPGAVVLVAATLPLRDPQGFDPVLFRQTLLDLA